MTRASIKANDKILDTNRIIYNKIAQIDDAVSDDNLKLGSIEKGVTLTLSKVAEGNSRMDEIFGLVKEIYKFQSCSATAVLSCQGDVDQIDKELKEKLDSFGMEIGKRNQSAGMSGASVKDAVERIRSDVSFRTAISACSSFPRKRLLRGSRWGVYRILIGEIHWSAKTYEVAIQQEGKPGYTDIHTSVTFDFIPNLKVLSTGFHAVVESTRHGWQTPMLKFPRYVPDDALVFKFCIDGNLPAIIELFNRGLASPHDRRIRRESSSSSNDYCTTLEVLSRSIVEIKYSYYVQLCLLMSRQPLYIIEKMFAIS